MGLLFNSYSPVSPFVLPIVLYIPWLSLFTYVTLGAPKIA